MIYTRTPAFTHWLRQTNANAEQMLWDRLRGHKLNGAEFRRRQSIGSYVVDFVCAEPRLVIELDDRWHEWDTMPNASTLRRRFLTAAGYRVLTFWHSEVQKDLDGVVNVISRQLSAAERRPVHRLLQAL